MQNNNLEQQVNLSDLQLSLEEEIISNNNLGNNTQQDNSKKKNERLLLALHYITKYSREDSVTINNIVKYIRMYINLSEDSIKKSILQYHKDGYIEIYKEEKTRRAKITKKGADLYELEKGNEEDNFAESLGFKANVSIGSKEAEDDNKKFYILVLQAIYELYSADLKINFRTIAEYIKFQLEEKRELDKIINTTRDYCKKKYFLCSDGYIRIKKSQNGHDTVVEITEKGIRFLRERTDIFHNEEDNRAKDKRPLDAAETERFISSIDNFEPSKSNLLQNTSSVEKNQNIEKKKNQKKRSLEEVSHDVDKRKKEKNHKKISHTKAKKLENLLIFLYSFLKCVENDINAPACVTNVVDIIKRYDKDVKRNISTRVIRYIKNGEYVEKVENGNINSLGYVFKLKQAGIDRIEQARKNKEFDFIEKLLADADGGSKKADSKEISTEKYRELSEFDGNKTTLMEAEVGTDYDVLTPLLLKETALDLEMTRVGAIEELGFVGSEEDIDLGATSGIQEVKESIESEMYEEFDLWSRSSEQLLASTDITFPQNDNIYDLQMVEETRVNEMEDSPLVLDNSFDFLSLDQPYIEPLTDIFQDDDESHCEIEDKQTKEPGKEGEQNIKQTSTEVERIVDSNTEEKLAKVIASEIDTQSFSVESDTHMSEANELSGEGFDYDSIREELAVDAANDVEQQPDPCNLSNCDDSSAKDISLENLPKEIPFIDSSFENPTFTFDFVNVEASGENVITFQMENMVSAEKDSIDNSSLKKKSFSINEWDIRIIFAVNELRPSTRVNNIIDFIKKYMEIYGDHYLKNLINARINAHTPDSSFLRKALEIKYIGRGKIITISSEGEKFMAEFFSCLERKFDIKKGAEEELDWEGNKESARKALILGRAFSIKKIPDKNGNFFSLNEMDEKILLAVGEKGGSRNGKIKYVLTNQIISFMREEYSDKRDAEVLRRAIHLHTKNDESKLCKEGFLTVEQLGREKYFKITKLGRKYLENNKIKPKVNGECLDEVKKDNLNKQCSKSSNKPASSHSNINDLLKQKISPEDKSSMIASNEDSKRSKNYYRVTKGRWGDLVYTNSECFDSEDGNSVAADDKDQKETRKYSKPNKKGGWSKVTYADFECSDSEYSYDSDSDYSGSDFGKK